mgnify:CR=1 FL=1
MTRSVPIEVYVDVDDVIDCLSEKEKNELCQRLCGREEKKKAAPKEEGFDAVSHLGQLSLWELKKLLCNTLGVSSYYDEIALREKLEEIIKAG